MITYSKGLNIYGEDSFNSEYNIKSWKGPLFAFLFVVAILFALIFSLTKIGTISSINSFNDEVFKEFIIDLNNNQEFQIAFVLAWNKDLNIPS